MATGGALLVLVLCLRPGLLAQDISLAEADTLIAAPAHLLALVPEAAQATVAAGYTEGGRQEANEGQSVTSKPAGDAAAGVFATQTVDSTSGGGVETPVEVIEHAGGNVGIPVEVVTVGALEDSTGLLGTPVETATSGLEIVGEDQTTPKEEILIVGDTRYQWQEWSPWHCNCPAGSMSRVRDITYSVPGVRLDPVQYNVLRFEREVCSYKGCHCDRKAHTCDQLEVSCKEAAPHICALKDIEHDQDEKRKNFWAKATRAQSQK
ncbi:protein MENT isoform X2 [Hemicordylus capensis]|uniref:protein MENT isoform X2 n=1 Tax=Hemicordylus capensis TaxID=884348 RepID=UPI0023021D3C|nr:protein MENT isoform X2 [Hemicordylus capensis]